jgi:cytochrome c-type biogenesis protein CcmE
MPPDALVSYGDGIVIETQTMHANVQVRPKRRRLVIGALLLAAIVVYLVLTAARGSTAYYLTVAELHSQGSAGRPVRVAGYVVGESIVWEPREMLLSFDVTDASGRLSVTYHGARPDMFRDQAEVVLEGKYTAQGVFEAKSMLLKCPSKYQEAAKDG